MYRDNRRMHDMSYDKADKKKQDQRNKTCLPQFPAGLYKTKEIKDKQHSCHDKYGPERMIIKSIGKPPGKYAQDRSCRTAQWAGYTEQKLKRTSVDIQEHHKNNGRKNGRCYKNCLLFTLRTVHQ